MNQVTATPARDAGDLIESVIVKGDLSKLTPAERSRYYGEVCRSVGLNPLTKPFEYIVLNGKLTLYALRNCTDQLRSLHNVSVVDLSESERDGVYIVTCKVQNGDGRTDVAKGAVTLGGLKGDALCNAIMKAETKAKRRATLSICGLGWLDESEVETIPAEVRQTSQPAQSVIAPQEQSEDELVAFMLQQIEAKTDPKALDEWAVRYRKAYERLSSEGQKRVKAAADKKRAFLSQASLPPHDPETGELPPDDPPLAELANYDARVAEWEHRLKGMQPADQDELWETEIQPWIERGAIFPPDRMRLERLIKDA